MLEQKVKHFLNEIGLYWAISKAYKRSVRWLSTLYRDGLYQKIKDTGVVPLPKFVIFEPTLRCNLTCRMCYLNKLSIVTQKDKSGLSLKEIKLIFDKLPKSIKKIVLTGGEPFMREDIFDIINYLGQKNLEISLLTNGYFTEKVQRLLQLNRLKRIVFSLHGPEALNNSIMGSKYSFDNIVTSINLAKAHKKVEVNLLCVINDENLDSLEDFVATIKQLNFNRFTLEFERRYDSQSIQESRKVFADPDYYSKLRISENVIPNYTFDNLKMKLEKVKEIARRHKIVFNYIPEFFSEMMELYYHRNMRKQNIVFCSALSMLRINSEGKVIPCFGIRKSMGSLLEYSFIDIWISDKYRDFRKKILKNNLLPICETCYSCKIIRKK